MPTWLISLTWPSKRSHPAMVKLQKTLRKLEKKENSFTKKAAQEAKKMKEFRVAGDEEAALLCSKKKKLWEERIKELKTDEFFISAKMIELEGAKARTETVDALRTGEAALKQMQKAINIDAVEIRESLSTPTVGATNSDEDALEAELEEPEGTELEEQLLQPATTAPAAPLHVPTGPHPACPVPQRTAKEDELVALQAEVTL